jgi:singapore isolate B (sub-type 7) whole genome shotgun sequence assembly, scaffold_6
VLNINTLVEIIIAFSETHDWRATFERCIPVRKVKVTDESGCNFDYHLIKSKEQLEGISEYRINRYEMKHALHIYCTNHNIPYEFKNEERTYEQHTEEFKGDFAGLL